MKYEKTFNPCDDCPHSFTKNNQESNVCKICEFAQSQDLINRQKAEIENYKHLDVILHTAIDKLAKDLKSEAYKEFAERLRDKARVNNLGDGFVYLSDINETEKELVGEDG